jgi:hypothetical protein
MKWMLAVLLFVGTLVARADEPKKPKLQPSDAQKIALSKVPGTVANQDSIVKDGHTNYSFDIQTEKELREVVVDGDTGTVVSNRVETTDDLAAKKKKKKAPPNQFPRVQ